MDPWVTTESEPNMAVFAPEGWEPKQVKSEQPATTHRQFKPEVPREIARCLSIPDNVAAGDLRALLREDDDEGEQGADHALQEPACGAPPHHRWLRRGHAPDGPRRQAVRPDRPADRRGAAAQLTDQPERARCGRPVGSDESIPNAEASRPESPGDDHRGAAALRRHRPVAAPARTPRFARVTSFLIGSYRKVRIGF